MGQLFALPIRWAPVVMPWVSNHLIVASVVANLYPYPTQPFCDPLHAFDSRGGQELPVPPAAMIMPPGPPEQVPAPVLEVAAIVIEPLDEEGIAANNNLQPPLVKSLIGVAGVLWSED